MKDDEVSRTRKMPNKFGLLNPALELHSVRSVSHGDCSLAKQRIGVNNSAPPL